MTLQEIVNNMTINQIKKDTEQIDRLLTCYKNTNQEKAIHKKFLKLYYDALNYVDSEKQIQQTQQKILLLLNKCEIKK